MRIERWFWLPLFCVISMVLHWGAALVTNVPIAGSPAIDPGSIEVAFTPAEIVAPKVEPKPPPVVKARPRPSVARGPHRPVVATFHVATVRSLVEPLRPDVTAARRPGVNPMPVSVKPIHPAVELSEQMRAEAPDASKRVVDPLVVQPRIRIARNNPRLVEGGGSLSPGLVPGGHGGLAAPENPKEDVLYTGQGSGGIKLPAIAPRTGGGGGKSILSASTENPLGPAIPDDKPGFGPGTGGGIGTAKGGGTGFAGGKGIGTDPDGRVALGSLRRKPGSGIGAAASGSETGTHAPGGGRGRGADLPGTGGTGTGYGRGHGPSAGDGSDDAAPPPRLRGVPFGNVAGLLGSGDNGGGDGAPGRGAVFGTHRSGGGEGAIHIVYALDISGSMRDGDKILKAKAALKKALGELRRSDTFNIIVFKRTASTFRDDSVPATPANVANARIFVEDIQIGDGTNISNAMDLALGMNGVTHIYLMSDGEPNGGISDFRELRSYIRENNKHNIKITTLALGLGENFPGMTLLKGIAEDNNGTYDYIDMTKIRREGR